FATNNPAITVANLGNVNTPNTTLSGLGSGNIVTLRWTITSGTCTPSFDDVVITRSACPLTAGFTWSPSTICATPSQINNISFTDASFAPSSTIQTWNWTFAGPTTPNPTSSTQQNPSNIQFTGPGSFTVTLTITDNASGNSQVTHTITISPYPAASGVVSGPAGSVCQGQTNVAFSVVPIANATSYNWTLPLGASIVSGSGTSSILVNFSNLATSGFVQAQGVNACGVGAASSPFNVTVNPLPGATSSINGPLTVCQGQTGVTFSTTSVPFATSYQWTLPPGATITSSSTAATITVDFAPNASGGTVDVIGINTCGNGTSSVGFTITMNPLPDAAGTITGTGSVCEGSTNIAYSISSVLNANSYTWTLPPGAVITSGAGTNSILVDYTNVTASGTVTVSGTNTCGNGTSATLPVNVAFLPDSSTAITGATTVCAGTSVQYNITAIPGASSYNWTLPPGVAITVDNGNSITVAYSATAQSGQITVNGVNACGNGVAGPGIAITVNPLPDTSLTISGPVTVCQGDTGVTFSIASVNNATNYGWILPLGATITAGDSTNSITVSFSTSAVSGTIMVMGHNGCGFGESADTLQLVVNPLPDAAQAVSGPGNIPICPASTGVVFTIPSVTNSDYYIWSLPPGATIVAGDSTNTITVDFTATSSSGAVIVAGENGCGQGTSSFLNFAVDEVTPIEICMVTVDSISLYNHVIWEKPIATDIDSFRIFREITSNVYLPVGAVPYDSLSLFIDSAYVPLADPNATFQRYKIASVDSCGNESVLSQHHRTLFLQANVGVGGVVNLNWVLYEGAGVSYYRILRDSTGLGNWEVIDSVAGTNFVYTDQTPPTTVATCGYKLQTIWLISCNPTRNINTSESNLEELTLTGINNGTPGVFAVDLYPNPTNGVVTVVYPPANDGATFEVRDALGRVVMMKTENSSGGGANSSVTTLDLSEFANGAYTLTITIGDQQVHKKVIIQK
ncbi:MAG TPA: T9SS type A sorting domain-containing protein, partial [Bacteroidia bacterium]|nr:T9SS type A sorting domain-containing protein [Bacteroidia bacterium]